MDNLTQSKLKLSNRIKLKGTYFEMKVRIELDVVQQI